MTIVTIAREVTTIFLSLYLKKCIVLSPQRKQYDSRHTIQQDDAADRKIIQLRFYNQRI